MKSNTDDNTHKKPVRCKPFHDKFSRKRTLKNHIPKVDNQGTRRKGSITYKCPLCDKLGPRSKLQIHFVIHTKELPFQCKYCLKDYKRRDTAIAHVKKAHAGVSVKAGVVLKQGSIFHNPNPWEEIGYSLNDVPNKTECAEDPEIVEDKKKENSSCMKKDYNADLPYKCLKCKKKFSRRLFLRWHLAMHVPANRCRSCKRKFSDKTNWKRHMLLRHNL